MNANLFAQSAASDTTFVEGSVLSNDGTKIGYRIYGSNKPALIIVQGAMGVIVNYHELAKALSHDFTVYVPERRGRPLSPKEYTSDHSIEKDVEDVSCVINFFRCQLRVRVKFRCSRNLRGHQGTAIHKESRCLRATLLCECSCSCKEDRPCLYYNIRRKNERCTGQRF